MKTIYNRTIKNETNFYMKISEKLVRDTNLTAAAKGIMLIILANNDSFEIYKTNIQKQSNMGKEGFNTVWKELEKYGYINTEKFITKEGAVYQYTINEDPCNSLILTPAGNPTVGFPTVGNPTTNNNQYNNNQYNNNPTNSITNEVSDETPAIENVINEGAGKALESTTSPTYGKPTVGKHTLKNNQYKNNTNVKTRTNEFAIATPAIESSPVKDIFNYLVEKNVEELGYKEAISWSINEQDIQNIQSDIDNLGEDVIMGYIDQHIKNHKRNMMKGTAKYENVSYAAIHNNVKDNKFREE